MTVAGRKLQFDGTINLGHVLTILAILAGGFSAWSSMQSNLAAVLVRVEAVERDAGDYQALANRVTAVETQLRNVDETLDRIYDAVTTLDARITNVQVTVTGVAAQVDRMNDRNGPGEL